MPLITDYSCHFRSVPEARQKVFHRHGSQGARHSAGWHLDCTFMPQEIPMAAGAVVVSLCSTSDETIEEKRRKICRATSAR
ncbi:hypothetical protein ACLB1M_02895 [Escherichia coli]